MSWLRQHCEGKSVLVVARVASGGDGYIVRLFAKGHIPLPGANSYPTRAIAFDVGDTLVRIRYPHNCGRLCTTWTDDPATD